MAALRFFFYLLMKPAALGFALLGLAGILAPFTDPNTWWVPAFSGLFMPVILIINLFLLVYWTFHKRWWLILPLVTILGNYNFLSSMFQWPWKTISVPTENRSLNIASYNVEGFYWMAQNPEQQVMKNLIEKNQLDILCIQEHCEKNPIDSATIRSKIPLPYRTVHFNRHTDWANFGLSIYSRYPIVRSGNIDFHSEKNSSMWADILIGQDTVRVFNNHLQTTDISPNTKKYNEYKSVKDWHGQARVLVNILQQLKTNFQIRARQSQLVRQIIDTTRYPVIICGDFNDTPISYAFNHMKGNDLSDGFRQCGKGYGHSFNGIRGLLRIDFIAYEEKFKGIEYFSPRLQWSDHNPVIMKLELAY